MVRQRGKLRGLGIAVAALVVTLPAAMRRGADEPAPEHKAAVSEKIADKETAGDSGKQETSLAWIPDSAAFYVSLLHCRQQIDAVRQSKAWDRLMKLPAVVEALEKYQKQSEDAESPAGKVQSGLANPQVQSGVEVPRRPAGPGSVRLRRPELRRLPPALPENQRRQPLPDDLHGDTGQDRVRGPAAATGRHAPRAGPERRPDQGPQYDRRFPHHRQATGPAKSRRRGRFPRSRFGDGAPAQRPLQPQDGRQLRVSGTGPGRQADPLGQGAAGRVAGARDRKGRYGQGGRQAQGAHAGPGDGTARRVPDRRHRGLDRRPGRPGYGKTAAQPAGVQAACGQRRQEADLDQLSQQGPGPAVAGQPARHRRPGQAARRLLGQDGPTGGRAGADPRRRRFAGRGPQAVAPQAGGQDGLLLPHGDGVRVVRVRLGDGSPGRPFPASGPDGSRRRRSVGGASSHATRTRGPPTICWPRSRSWATTTSTSTPCRG